MTITKIILTFEILLLLFTMIIVLPEHFVMAGTFSIINVPGDYSTIQAAINGASSGDTILVGPNIYYELITVNKGVKLIGKNRQTTIIDGNKTGPIVKITVSNVEIRNFTIQNGASYVGIWVEDPTAKTITGVVIQDNTFTGDYVGVVMVRCVGLIISRNTMEKNQYGIRTAYSSLNEISDNIINSNLFYGIHLHSQSQNNTIKYNTFTENKYGIHLEWSNNNLLEFNTLRSLTSKNGYGVRLTSTTGTRIISNSIETNYYGIVLWESSINNTIYHNNFIDNSIQAYHSNTPLTANTWDTNVCPGAEGNYWNDYKGLDNGIGVGRWGEPRVANDGIGDTLTPHLSVDYYPLMHPWSPWPIAKFTWTPETPYVDETVTFNATASLGNIATYEWNFGDGTPKVTESDPITTHVYKNAGNYTVTLTVTTRDGYYNSTSKIITVLSFRVVIDVYTQKEPYSGKGTNMPSDAFVPEEEVILYANVTLNDAPVPDKIVNFYIFEPNATEPFLYRTNTTDENGFTYVAFRLGNTPPFGTYKVVANVEVVQTIAEDTITFRVGWIIEILSIETVNKYGELQTDFRKREAIYFKLVVQNIAFVSKNVTIAVVAYDEKETPIGLADLQLKIDPGWSELNTVFSILIPSWSLVGSAEAHASALTDWAWANGIPYCPEAIAGFMVYS